MNFLHEYSGFSFELNFKLNHFQAGFNEKMNFQNVSNRAKVFKALASDPNATKDTKDRVRQADQNEDKLYKVENKLFSSQILLEMG